MHRPSRPIALNFCSISHPLWLYNGTLPHTCQDRTYFCELVMDGWFAAGCEAAAPAPKRARGKGKADESKLQQMMLVCCKLWLANAQSLRKVMATIFITLLFRVTVPSSWPAWMQANSRQTKPNETKDTSLELLSSTFGQRSRMPR